MMFDCSSGSVSPRSKTSLALNIMDPTAGKGDQQQSSTYDQTGSKRGVVQGLDSHGNPKRLRGDAAQLMQQQQQGNFQQQQQLDQQQLQQQQQMLQQQQQSDQLAVDNILGRPWGGSGSGVEPSDMNSVLRAMFNSGGQGQNNSVGQSNLLFDDSFRRAELSAQILREQAARNQAAQNAAFLASIGRPNTIDNMFPAGSAGGGQTGSLNWAALQQQNSLQQTASSQQAQQLVALRSLTDFDPFRQGGNLSLNQGPPFSSLLNNSAAPNERNQDIATLLRQMQSTSSSNTPQQQSIQSNIIANQQGSSNFAGLQGSNDDAGIGGVVVPQPLVGELELPPCEEGLIESYTNRPSFHLGIDEDPNWLSEFHCFVRSELVEVFRASHEDVKARNNSIAYHQVGIRCRFCAHMTPSARAGRSSAFPSSLRQIYQSFTMMLRDHFGNCDAMPTATQDRFMLLKDKPAQGATDSKRYWMYSAMKIGMTDSSDGIMITEQTRAVGARTPPFGVNPGQRWEDDAFRSVPLVLPSDRPLVSEFLYVLMSQVQPIRLTEAECIGNRRSLRVGLPGFGCRFCCENRRLGLCRMFPARRRTLPTKVNDVYDHLRRCTVCPDSIKKHLERTKHQMNTGFHADQGGDREFFDKVWNRLGHESQAA